LFLLVFFWRFVAYGIVDNANTASQRITFTAITVNGQGRSRMWHEDVVQTAFLPHIPDRVWMKWPGARS
jgi:hypothetical protein